jgi:hypothetical protein
MEVRGAGRDRPPVLMIKQFDELEGYCRRLGHYLSFRYCRRVNQDLPCPVIRDCWFERLPIDEFLERHYSPEQLAILQAPAPGKLSTILGLLPRS